MDPINIIWTDEYLQWFLQQELTIRAQISARLARIKFNHHFGDTKLLGEHLAELRWKNGQLIYFTKLNHQNILILLGGTKNGQKKDIKKSRILLQRHERN